VTMAAGRSEGAEGGVADGEAIGEDFWERQRKAWADGEERKDTGPYLHSHASSRGWFGLVQGTGLRGIGREWDGMAPDCAG